MWRADVVLEWLYYKSVFVSCWQHLSFMVCEHESSCLVLSLWDAKTFQSLRCLKSKRFQVKCPTKRIKKFLHIWTVKGWDEDIDGLCSWGLYRD